MSTIIQQIFSTTIMIAKSINLRKDGTLRYVMLAICLSLCSLLLIMLWISDHFGYALYFGHNLSIIDSTQSSSILPQIAATENGSVYVVWLDKNNIYSSSSQDNGTKFSAPLLLSDSSKLASSPQLAATENGNVYVAWVDKNSKSGDSDIKFRSSNDSGKSFDDDKRLSRKNDILSSSPQIAATEKGNVYVAWVDKNSTSGDTDIKLRVSTVSGVNFSRSVPLNEDLIEIPISSPQIAATENGYVYVVWYQNDVHFREILDDGNILGRTVFLDNSTSFSSSPQIAATEKGNVYVIWVDKNSTNKDSVLALKRIGEFFIDPNS